MEVNAKAEKILEDLNTKARGAWRHEVSRFSGAGGPYGVPNAQVKPGKDNTDAGGEPAKEVEAEHDVIRLLAQAAYAVGR